MAICSATVRPVYSCATSPSGSRYQNKRRYRGAWVRAVTGVLMLLADVPLLAGSTAGKGSCGPAATQLGRSANRLAKLLPFKNLEEGIPRAVALAELEQEIEDLNIMHKFDRRLERLAMVMPLTDHFDPGVTHFAHEHLQEGDKISVPSSILSELIRKQAEIPWQFELKLVRRKAPGEYEPVDLSPPPREALAGKKEMPMLSSVACSILDARSPETFVFVPDWMMKALRLKPRDIVLYRHKDLNKASKIVLQPHSSAFLKMSNHQAVMETELRHYSAIARGTTIAFRYRKTLYEFNVLECIDTDGKSQDAVCVQDSDVATDFHAALDTPAGRRQSVPTSLGNGGNTGAVDEDAGVEGYDEEDEEDDEEQGWGSDEF